MGAQARERLQALQEVTGLLFERRVHNVLRQFRAQTVSCHLFRLEGQVVLPSIADVAEVEIPDPRGEVSGHLSSVQLDAVTRGSAVWCVGAKQRAGDITWAQIDLFARETGTTVDRRWYVSNTGFRTAARLRGAELGIRFTTVPATSPAWSAASRGGSVSRLLFGGTEGDGRGGGEPAHRRESKEAVASHRSIPTRSISRKITSSSSRSRAVAWDDRGTSPKSRAKPVISDQRVTMQRRQIEVTEELVERLQHSRLGGRSAADQVRIAVAIHLYLQGLISIGKARGPPSRRIGSPSTRPPIERWWRVSAWTWNLGEAEVVTLAREIGRTTS